MCGQLLVAYLAQRTRITALRQQGEGGAAKAGGRDISFEAALLAAAALAALGVNDGVTEFPGKAAGTVEELAIGDDAAAEPGPEGNDDEILHITRAAKVHLPESGGIGVVGDRHRQVIVALKKFHQINRCPPLQVRRVLHRPATIIGVGGADADPLELETGGKIPMQPCDPGLETGDQSCCRLLCFGGDHPGGKEIPVAIDEAKSSCCPTDIDAEDHLVIHVSSC